MRGSDMNKVRCEPAVGFPGYRVGADGSVWSTRSRSGSDDATAHRLMPQLRGRSGRKYLSVAVYRERKRIQIYVHQLVLEAFSGPCPAGCECRHLDGDRFNNSADNLVWGTKGDNTKDQIQHGTFKNNLPAGKVNADLLLLIKILAAKGFSRKEISKQTGISRGTIWRHLGSTRNKTGY